MSHCRSRMRQGATYSVPLKAEVWTGERIDAGCGGPVIASRVVVDRVTEREEADRVFRGSPPTTCGDDGLLVRG